MKYTRRLLACLLMVLVLATSTVPALANDWQEEDFESEMIAYGQEVLRLINIERVENGLHELEWDWDLTMCAQIRAEELTVKYSHERPNPPSDTDKQWPANIMGGGIYNAPSVADELGVGYKWIYECAVAARKTSQAAVDAWQGSPSHWNVIMLEEITRCGVGVYFTDEKTPTGYKQGWALWMD